MIFTISGVCVGIAVPSGAGNRTEQATSPIAPRERPPGPLLPGRGEGVLGPGQRRVVAGHEHPGIDVRELRRRVVAGAERVGDGDHPGWTGLSSGPAYH